MPDRPIFELSDDQLPRRPKVRTPESEEIPEGFNNALDAIEMSKNNLKATNQERPASPPRQIPIPVEDQVVNEAAPVISGNEEVLVLRSAQEIINQLKKKQRYEEVMLPSRSLLYEKYGLEPDKPIHVRPMTIEEEKIISTPRLIRSGQAIDKIFDACIYENISSGKLLSIDRTFLLFYIRGISYGPDYEVDIKCPSCDVQFSQEINLDILQVEMCKDNFDGEISCVLPDSGLAIRYRLPTGDDEKSLSRHRDMMIRGGFRNDAPDDTLIRRNIMLITNIESHTDKRDIEQIVSNLGVKDSNFIRDQITNPNFGIFTEVSMNCDYCYHEWELDLPIDVNFFFPRTKKTS